MSTNAKCVVVSFRSEEVDFVLFASNDLETMVKQQESINLLLEKLDKDSLLVELEDKIYKLRENGVEGFQEEHSHHYSDASEQWRQQYREARDEQRARMAKLLHEAEPTLPFWLLKLLEAFDDIEVKLRVMKRHVHVEDVDFCPEKSGTIEFNFNLQGFDI